MIVCMLLAMGPAACGDSGASSAEDAKAVRTAYAKLSADVAAGRFAAACTGITDGAARYVGSLGHGTPRSCESNLARFFRMTGAQPARVPPRAIAVRVHDESATVLARREDGWTVQLPFVRVGESWKARNILGVSAGPTPDVG